MEDRIKSIHSRFNETTNLIHKVELELAKKLGLTDLRAGKATIRDERNWRTNEKWIEYSWLVQVSRSFIGWCWIFTIKFKENDYRDIKNPEEIVKGLFTINESGEISIFYSENQKESFDDKIKNIKSYDLFDINNEITLDGVSYDFLIYALNADIKFSIHNPRSESWKKWENEIWELGKQLTINGNLNELRSIFE